MKQKIFLKLFVIISLITPIAQANQVFYGPHNPDQADALNRFSESNTDLAYSFCTFSGLVIHYATSTIGQDVEAMTKMYSVLYQAVRAEMSDSVFQAWDEINDAAKTLWAQGYNSAAIRQDLSGKSWPRVRFDVLASSISALVTDNTESDQSFNILIEQVGQIGDIHQQRLLDAYQQVLQSQADRWSRMDTLNKENVFVYNQTQMLPVEEIMLSQLRRSTHKAVTEKIPRYFYDQLVQELSDHYPHYLPNKSNRNYQTATGLATTFLAGLTLEGIQRHFSSCGGPNDPQRLLTKYGGLRKISAKEIARLGYQTKPATNAELKDLVAEIQSQSYGRIAWTSLEQTAAQSARIATGSGEGGSLQWGRDFFSYLTGELVFLGMDFLSESWRYLTTAETQEYLIGFTEGEDGIELVYSRCAEDFIRNKTFRALLGQYPQISHGQVEKENWEIGEPIISSIPLHWSDKLWRSALRAGFRTAASMSYAAVAPVSSQGETAIRHGEGILIDAVVDWAEQVTEALYNRYLKRVPVGVIIHKGEYCWVYSTSQAAS